MTLNKGRIEIALAKACLNPYDLCAKIGMQYQNYHRIVNGGESKPKTIGKIARALGIEVTEIIEQEKAGANE